MKSHKLESLKTHLRLILFLLFYIPIVIYTSIVVYATFHTLQHPIFWLLTIFFLIVFGFLVIQIHFSDLKREKELDKLKEKREQLTNKIEQEKEFDIFQTIELSLNHLTEYYTINKGQAKSSFQFSIFAIVVGLITIVSGIVLIYLGNKSISSLISTSVSGVLLEFIGGAYFFIYKRSLDQINVFYKQLVKIQDTMLSINIAKSITDPVKRVDVEEKIIMSLLQRSSS